MFKSFQGHQAETQATATPVNIDAMAVLQKKPAVPNATAARGPQVDAVAAAWLELKQRMHQMVLESMNLAAIEKVGHDELRREIGTLVAQDLQQYGPQLGADRFKTLVTELMDEVLGLGPLEPLMADETVSDILVNGHNKIFVERRGILEKSDVHFSDERHLLRVIDKIVSRVGRRIDESQPWVDARLEDGSRVNAIIRPCAIDGPSLSIRKFSADKLTLERLVEFGALNSAAATFLEAIVKARMNVLISGGTGSGKTTMLNAMSSHVDHRQRIVTIEDAAELQLQQDHVVRLETRPSNVEGSGEISQRELVKNALRMRPDRIIIGEVRGNEAFDMLQAMNTGHDGSMTTIHANTARDSIARLEQMVVMVGNDFPLSAVRQQISSGINVVVQLNRLADGSRRVMSISEIAGMEESTILMQDIFKFTKSGIDADGNVIGHFGSTGVRPRCAETLEAAGIKLPVGTFTAQQVAK
ncbi:pilus assembly protein CpaF [Litoreibacter ponti]|uniref:Pilus assembly protein CpaF n=1 Tax=Litoreibacter ponti TaxID=1510457 RepID=A0A2T6BF10_9RHOB|nr:CpaF family protein [Litoreibacter ponti]PTX54646.1 pilus assembly protein CpaF [Litoreibacter ponti]